MDWQNEISFDPGVLLGKPIIRGTRLSVELIIDLLAKGWTSEQIISNYPGLNEKKLQACLAYAGEALRQEMVYPGET